MRPIRILYLLVTYVVLQFCWWAYLLTEQTEELFEHKIELVKERSTSSEDALLAADLLDRRLSQRKWMVIGEGLVFLSLLLWGSHITYRSFRKEYELARLQKNFLLSVTHEFKSPLASIRLYLETLQQRELDKERTKKFLASALLDTDRLNQLVENALMANLIEHPEHVLHKEKVNLSELVRATVERFRSIPEFSDISAEIGEELILIGDKQALSIVLVNLIENAVKYSTASSPVYLSLDKDQGSALLQVADQGIGIPDAEKDKIFRKFYRVGNEDTRSSKGTGLGLYLSCMIVRKHNGTIKAVDNKPQGTIFQVRLPLA